MRPRLSQLLLPLLAVGPVAAQASRPPAVPMAEAVRFIEELDAMRSGLAAGIGAGEAPDSATFAQVCRPVGARARTEGAARGWQVAQLAERNRNPANALDEEGKFATRVFERHPGVLSLWLTSTREGQPGIRYFRRIEVEQPCLACHGDAAARPAFIQQRYPQDRAYGFAVGDLRGVYAVFIPDSAPAR